MKTPTRRAKWLPYVRRLADILALKDWRIDVLDELPSGDGAFASIYPIVGRKWANLRMSEEFLVAPKLDQRQTIAHELVHCHFAPLLRLLEARDQYDDAMRHALEYGVDGLADGIAPLLPLPPAKL